MEVPSYFESYSPSILLFHNFSQSYTGSLHDISVHPNDIFWTKYGITQSGFLNNTKVYIFFLNKPIPDTDNPFIINQQDPMILEKNELYEEIFTLRFNQDNITIPGSWLNSTMIFGEISCTVDGISDSSLTLRCPQTSFQALNQHFIEGRWYNDDFYYSNTVSCSTMIKDKSSTVLTLSQVKPAKVDHVVFTDPFMMQVKVLEFDGIHLSLENDDSSNLQLVADSVSSFCLQEAYFSTRDLLLQSPDHCSMSFIVKGLENVLVYLDVGDQIEIEAVFQFESTEMLHSKTSSMEWLKVQFSQPDILHIRTSCEKTKKMEEMKITILQKWAHQAVNLLTISPVIQNPSCSFQKKEFQILNACPPDKKMVFEYPYSITTEDLFALNDIKDRTGVIRVFKLPTNYQPPSSLGIGIPQTPHVYNADPSKPFFHERYLEDQTRPIFKQCKGMKNR